MTEEILKQQYRASVVLKDSKLASKNIYEPIINGIFPHAIDRELDQTIQSLTLVNCDIGDDALKLLIDNFAKYEQSDLYYMNLSQNKLSSESASTLGSFL